MIIETGRLKNGHAGARKVLAIKDIVKNKRVLYDRDGRKRVLKRNRSTESVSSSQLSHTNTNNSASSLQQRSRLKHDPNLNFDALLDKPFETKPKVNYADLV